jgi:hypothetical protein
MTGWFLIMTKTYCKKEHFLSGCSIVTIGEKLLALKEVVDKIHDKSLLPKEGIRWGNVNLVIPAQAGI